MKKLLAVLFGIMLVVSVASVSFAANAGNAPAQQSNGKAGQDGEWVESNVSQTQIDNVMKREEAVSRVEEKLRIRERNVNSNDNETDPNKLFRSSK